MKNLKKISVIISMALLSALVISVIAVPSVYALVYTADTTFTPGSILGTTTSGTVSKIAVQTDGKLVLGGTFNTTTGAATNRIMRLNADGTADTTFNTNIGTGFDFDVKDIDLQSDGKIIVSGIFNNFNGTLTGQIVRLNTDGTLDGTFNLPGSGATKGFGTGSFTYGVNALTFRADGKLFVVYNALNFAGIAGVGGTLVLNTDGSVDTTYPYTVVATNPSDVIALSSGDAIISTAAAPRVRKINMTTGAFDTAFDTAVGTGFNNTVSRLKEIPGTGILASGIFTTYKGVAANQVAIINYDGTRNTTFNTGTGFAGGQVSDALVQPDGKILVIGSFSSYNGSPNFSALTLTRLLSDGTRDTSFEIVAAPYTAGVFNQFPHAIVQQADGKIVIGGQFSLHQGITARHIVRLINPDTTAPVLSAIHIASNNTNTAQAKAGDTITLTFTSDDVVTSSTISIAGQTVTATCTGTGPQNCTATLVVPAGAPVVDGVVSLSISATSDGGTSSASATTDASQVTIDRVANPISFSPDPLTNTNQTVGSQIYVGCEPGGSITFTSLTNVNPSTTPVICPPSGYILTISTGPTVTIEGFQTDLAGNVSTPVIANYTMIPGPSTPDLATSSDHGPDTFDNITNETLPTFVGSCFVAGTVTLNFLPSIAPITASGPCDTGTNTYTITPSAALSQGYFSVSATDAAGTSGVLSNILISTGTPGTTISVTSPTNNVSPTFTGSCSGVGSSIEIVFDGVTATVPCVLGVSYTYTPVGASADGTYTVSATETDIAGNVSTVTETVVIDNVAPTVTGGSVAGSVITLPVSDALSGVDSTATGIPATTDFVVLVNGIATTIQTVAVSGTTITITLTTPVVATDVVTVEYIQPVAAPRLMDVVQNATAGFGPITLTNTTAVVVTTSGGGSSGSRTKKTETTIATQTNTSPEGLKCPYFTQFMKKGDRDGSRGTIVQPAGISQTLSEVHLLQKFLADTGYAPGPQDGIFGSQTESAFAAWQTKNFDVVLAPWGRTVREGPTKKFYQSSRHHANVLVGCKQPTTLDNGVTL